MDLERVAQRLAEAVAEALEADGAAVLLLEGGRLSLAASRGPHLGPAASDLDRQVMEEGEVVVVEGGHALPQGCAALACAPLQDEEQVWGTVHVYAARPGHFSPARLGRLEAVADLGGMAVGMARALGDMRAAQAKARFARVATHELRSPIAVAQSLLRTVLKGYAGPLTPRQQEIFRRVAGRLDFLENLVNDLLDLAAGRSPELDLDEQPVLLNASAGRVVLLLGPHAEEKGVSLSLHPCREELVVWASEEGLDRILVNLVGNGIKYTPAGGQVTVSMGQEGEEVWVRVADTGIGIPEESFPHLFEEFYRAPNARRFGTGTGLGLTIVKDLVDRYEGRIEVESKVGEGTTFTIFFPRWRG